MWTSRPTSEVITHRPRSRATLYPPEWRWSPVHRAPGSLAPWWFQHSSPRTHPACPAIIITHQHEVRPSYTQLAAVFTNTVKSYITASFYKSWHWWSSHKFKRSYFVLIKRSALHQQSKAMQPLYRPRQALWAPDGWCSQNSQTIGTCRWHSCQPYEPVAFTPRKYSCYLCQRLSRPQGHNAAGRIKSMKNSNGTIGNQTRDLPPPRTPLSIMVSFNLWTKFHPLWITTYSLVWHVIQDEESKHSRAVGHRNKFCVLAGS